MSSSTVNKPGSGNKAWGAVTFLWDYIATRFKNIDIFDEHHQLEAKTNPFYALGPIFYLVWFITMASGLVLIMWYVPTKAAAYDSIYAIQWHVPFGNIVRGVHKYGADAMIIAATMRVFRMFILADYKPSKEFNIAIGLIMLLLSMYSGLTGYLLIWNQRAFWATKVFATFPTYMDQFPVMGDYYEPLVKSLHLGWNTAEVLLGAGGAITQETITRFFSLHLAFSLIPLILVEIYFYNNNYVRMPLNWIKRFVITSMLVITAIILPAAQGRRSDPDVTPLPILSDWYFLGLYQMYKYLEPVVATEITMVIPVTVILLPFLDTWIAGPEKNIMKRPFILMMTIMGGVSWIAFSYLIIINVANIHNDPPFWRSLSYLAIDAGIIWQLVMIWQSKDAKEWAKGVRPSVVMFVLGAIQTVLAVLYYYMAKTEMFMSPLTQAFTYLAFRPFWANKADELESTVRTLVPKGTEMPYNTDFTVAATSWIQKIPQGDVALQKLEELKNTPSAVDWMFQLIPTFDEKNPVYKGAIDYMVANKWAWDYVNFYDRMNLGNLNPKPFTVYPMNVPEVDWWWMIGGAVTALFSVVTFFMARSKSQASATDKKA
jgi:quinol-cytochrome oxidoreductase complex cytochrome b subunit